MPTTYLPAPDDLTERLQAVVEKTHPELAEAGVTFLVQVARNDTGPAVTHHGYPAAAVVSIVNLKDRVAGLADCRMRIDAEYTEWPEEQLESTLDHEAEHLLLVRDKEGNVKRDDAGRPKLRLRKHDIYIGGFQSILKRHGKAAFEAQALHEAVKASPWLFADF